MKRRGVETASSQVFFSTASRVWQTLIITVRLLCTRPSTTRDGASTQHSPRRRLVSPHCASYRLGLVEQLQLERIRGQHRSTSVQCRWMLRLSTLLPEVWLN